MGLFVGKKQRVLLVGSSGFLGYAIGNSIAEATDLFHTYNKNRVHIYGSSGMRMRLESEARMCELLSEWRPATVIVAAGLTDHQQCEEDWDSAYRINVRGLSDFLQLAEEISARVIHLSCAEIFDGAEGPHIETSDVFPRSRFGKMISMVEETVRAGVRRGQLVLRLPLVYGWSRGPRKGFMGNLVEAAEAGRGVPLRDDVVINPIDLFDLCRAIDKVLVHKDGGVFHLGGREELSFYEFGRRVCEEFGLSPETVRPVRQGDREAGPTEAGNYVLRAEKALRVLSWQARSLHEGLRRAKEARDRSEKSV